MTLVDQINKDFIEAYKTKEELVVSVLRLLKSAIKNAEIAKKEVLNDNDIVAVIKKEIKQRKESIEMYKKAENSQLAEKEEKEICILEKYLPSQLSEEKIQEIVDQTILETGAKDVSQTGQVIGKIMSQYGGQVDGSLVSKITREKLQNL